MLEYGDYDITECPSVRLAGPSEGPMPEQIYGMLSALLLRSGDMGDDVASAMADLGVPLPEGSFRVVQFSLDDPILAQVPVRDRHRCRISLYDRLRDWVLEQLDPEDRGFLFLLSGDLLGILYTGGREITSLCEAAAEYAKLTLGVSIHVNISTRWNDVKNVGQAYRMISDVENSRTFFTDMIGQVFSIPEGVFDRLNNTAERTEMEQSFLHASNRICGSIRAGEAEIAAGYLREELRQIAENSLGMPYPTTLTLTINQFISVLQYTLVAEDLADLRYLARRDSIRNRMDRLVRDIEQGGEYPLFVKPAGTGSSVGVSKVRNTQELKAALELAAKYDSKVLVEEFISGHEVEVAVMGNDTPVASVVGEILAGAEFYDYDAKYNSEESRTVIPAEIPERAAQALRDAAVTVYKAMGCRGMSRVDFFLTYEGEEVVFNEINTLPGFTSISMYPKLFEASGVPYENLLDELIRLAMEA